MQMVVIKKPGMFNEDKQPEFKTDIAKSLSDANIQGNEDTVSDIPVVKKKHQSIINPLVIRLEQK